MSGIWEDGKFVLATTKNDEITSLRQQVTELKAKLSIAIEALELYSANKKIGLNATEALTKIRSE